MSQRLSVREFLARRQAEREALKQAEREARASAEHCSALTGTTSSGAGFSWPDPPRETPDPPVLLGGLFTNIPWPEPPADHLVSATAPLILQPLFNGLCLERQQTLVEYSSTEDMATLFDNTPNTQPYVEIWANPEDLIEAVIV